MSFETGFLTEAPNTGEGEKFGGAKIELSTPDFETGLKVGYFAQYLGTTLSNIDATATPKIAGVVMRDMGTAISSNATIDKSIESNAMFINQGLVSVVGLDTDTPLPLDTIFMINVAGATGGTATTTSTASTVDTTAQYIRTLSDGKWLIKIV